MAAKKTAAKGKVAKKRRVKSATTNGATLRAISRKQTKTQVLGSIAEETGLTRAQVGQVLTSLGGLARRHIMARGSGEFAIPDMGLKVRRVRRKARMARNPMTGEAVRVPAKTVVRATVLKALKTSVG